MIRDYFIISLVFGITGIAIYLLSPFLIIGPATSMVVTGLLLIEGFVCTIFFFAGVVSNESRS